jgi:F0F1-type ATP synthase membrane subunit b/b'
MIESILSSLGVNQTIFIQAGIFVVCFAVVYFLALGRLTDTLVERDSRIEGREAETRKLSQELLEIKNELEKNMSEARKQASTMFQDLKLKAATEQKAILAASRDTAQLEMKSVRTQIASQLDTEIKRLESEVPGIARMILEKVAGGKAIPQKISSSGSETRREV